MIHASLENCTIWVCLKMWYPQVQRMINCQCQLAILVSAPLFSVFHQHVSMNWLKGNMSRNPRYMIGDIYQILSRAFDAHFAQARRTPPVCGHWAVLTQQQKDPAKHLQNICQAALILAPCHTVWAIMSSHMCVSENRLPLNPLVCHDFPC